MPANRLDMLLHWIYTLSKHVATITLFISKCVSTCALSNATMTSHQCQKWSTDAWEMHKWKHTSDSNSSPTCYFLVSCDASPMSKVLSVNTSICVMLCMRKGLSITQAPAISCRQHAISLYYIIYLVLFHLHGCLFG